MRQTKITRDEGEQPPPRVEQDFQKYQQALQQEHQRARGLEM